MISTVLLSLIFLLTTGCQAILNLVQPPAPEPAVLLPDILNSRPHDPNAFTQGFVLTDDGRLFESTGLEGRSSLREVDPQTGEVLRQHDLTPDIFAEGLALVDHRLIQITWKNGIAFIYDRDTFDPLGTYNYSGEGWGLCYDTAGDQLYMSDGSSNLFIRDPQTFDLTGQIAVTLQGQPVDQLNELECVGDKVYANVWQTNAIVVIDKVSGAITDVINAADLLTPEEYAALPGDGVLNGIASDSQSGNFLITGKLFPKMFEVQFVRVEPTE